LDGIPDQVDNCPFVKNPFQEDNDGDDVGNVCDYCPNTPPGTTVDINGCSPCNPPVIVSAVSRMDHGTTGPFDIDLFTDPVSAVYEMRQDPAIGGAGPSTIVVTFNCDIQAIDGTPDATEVTLSSGIVNYVTIVGSVLTIDMQDTDNNACLTVTLHGIVSVTDDTCQTVDPDSVMADTDLYLKVVLGQVDGAGCVCITDLGLVKSQLFKPVTSTNFEKDVKADGFINLFDLGLVKSNLFKQGSGVFCP
jgi:hypothetical protein